MSDQPLASNQPIQNDWRTRTRGDGTVEQKWRVMMRSTKGVFAGGPAGFELVWAASKEQAIQKVAAMHPDNIAWTATVIGTR